MGEPVREGVEDGIQWRIMANDVLFLWQGYAHIPDGHVRRHLNADGIEPLVDVYGGVAYGPDQLRLALKTADTGERIRLLNGACRTRAMRSVSSPSSTRTARGGPHAVKSRVRTIMLNRRVYRVAMQAKGGR